MEKALPLTAVRDLAVTIRFYEKQLGFRILSKYPLHGKPSFVTLSKDGVELMFQSLRSLLEMHPNYEKEVESNRLGVGFSLHLKVKDVDRLYWELKSNRIPIIYNIETKPHGIREFTIKDPDGYLVTLAEHLPLCQSCGMPMPYNEARGGKDPNNPYCIYCTTMDGDLKPYEEVLNWVAADLMRNGAISKREAKEAARRRISDMPAWRRIKR